MIRGPQTVVDMFIVPPSTLPVIKSEEGQIIIGESDEFGAAKEKFTIHKDFLCHYSPYFEAAFNGPLEEGKTQSITLDNIQPAVFGMFVHWL